MAMIPMDFGGNDISTASLIASSENFNSYNSASHYGFYSWTTPAPTNAPFNSGSMMVTRLGSASLAQIAFGGTVIASRTYSSGTWSAWYYQRLSEGDTTCSSTVKKTGLANLSPVRRGNAVVFELAVSIPAGTYTGGNGGTVLWTVSPKPLKNMHFWGIRTGSGTYSTLLLTTDGNIYFNANTTLSEATYVIGQCMYLTDGAT